MIDLQRIEQIKLLSTAKAKVAMKEYAEELGVNITSKTIDNMVSEMSSQLNMRSIIPRAKVVTIEPASVNTIVGAEIALYAKLEDIPDPETVTYSWTKDGNAIAGQTTQRLVIDKCAASDAGKYKCKVTETDSTETESGEVDVAVNVIPVGFNPDTLYKAQWIEFHGLSYAHVRWDAIDAANEILAGNNADTPVAFQTELLKNPVTIPLLALFFGTTSLIATDSRNGYRHQIDTKTCKGVPIKVFGPFTGS
ncbi:MAG: immunoglobulin domain-containing protein [Bacilli bacterium]